MTSPQEIKGSAFVVLGRWLTENQGEDAYASLLAALSEGDRATVSGALASQWYPEELHGRVLRRLFEVNARGDIARFEAIIDGCTLLGVQTFARLILSMSTTAFMLRRAPTLWSVIRRGPATLAVEQTDERSRLAYRQFPFFGDELYRHYFRALLMGVVRPTLGRDPSVKVFDWGPSSLDVEILHR